MTQSGGAGQSAGIQLQVGLDLAYFRSEMQKVSNIASSEFAGRFNVRFNRSTLDAELNNLQKAIKRRVYRVEIGGNIDSLPAKIESLRTQLAALQGTKIDVEVGVVAGLSKRDAKKIKSDLRQKLLDGDKKISVPVTITPSITREDVRNFKSVVKEKLSGITVQVKAEAQGKGFAGSSQGVAGLMEFMQSQGLLGKVAPGMQMRMRQDGTDVSQQLSEAVQSAEKIKSIFDGVAKNIATTGKAIANVGGKRLGLNNVPLMAGSVERRVSRSAASIEGTLSSDVLRLLYPEVSKTISSLTLLKRQIQQNTSKLSGFSLLIGVAAFAGVPLAKSIVTLTGSADSFAKLLDGLGPKLQTAFLKAAANVLKASSTRLLSAGTPAGLLPPAYRGIEGAAGPAGLLPPAYRGIGPSRNAGALPPAYRGLPFGFDFQGLRPDKGESGKLALTDEMMQERFPVQNVKVREMFDPREFEFGTMRLLRAIGVALEQAANQADQAAKQAKNARIENSVNELMRSIDVAIKIAQAQVRNARGVFAGQVQVRDLGRTAQQALPFTRTAGLLAAGVGRTTSRYSTGPIGGESRSELIARREQEARMRSAQRETRILSERPSNRLPGTTFMGDSFTAGGGRDRVRGSGQPPQRGGAIVPFAASTKLPANYYETVNKYSQAVNLANAATSSFTANQMPFIGGLRSLAGEFGEATKQVLLYGTAYKGLAFLISLPRQVLNAAKSQQQFNNAMEVATLTSGTYAKELLFVDNVQKAFGLDLDSTRSGFVRLYASMSPTGFDSGSIEKLFVGISSAMAALQLTPDKADRVIYAFGQMASKGQLMSEELKGQLGDVLPGALAIFASAAGKSVEEFNKELEDGVYSGQKFRDLMTKVTDELITRFGSGASAAGRSLQGLINIVKGDFTRTLESFAPLANSAAESILRPLSGALRELSTAAKLATGERGRAGLQVRKQEEVVQGLGEVVQLGGPDVERAKEQYEGAKQSLEVLKIELENLNELAKDPAIAEQARNIQAFTEEIAKAGTFVKNLASFIGGGLSPVLAFLGTNLTAVISAVAVLGVTFQATRLAMLAFAGAVILLKGGVAAVGFLNLVVALRSVTAAIATSGVQAKTVAAIYKALGISASVAGGQIVFAAGATMTLRGAIIALMATSGIGLVVALVGTVGAAFLAMGDNAKQAAEDAKQATKDIAEAARTGNVAQVESALRQASADVQLIKDAQAVVQQKSSQKQGIYGVSGPRTLTSQQLSEEDKVLLDAAGISLPDRGATEKELTRQLNEALAIREKVLRAGESRRKLAQRQQARTGQAIPGTGMQQEDPVDDKGAQQRASALLNAIEQREDAIADARQQREERIAQIRKDAIEGVAKIEQSLADKRQKIEREIAQINRRSSDNTADIERQIRIASGEDRDLVESEQKIVDIFRKGRDERLSLADRIADEEQEQARSIADFQKKIAKELRDADEAHTKKMGDIQRNYARQVAKVIEDGTGKAAKRMAVAGELAGRYIERAYLLQQEGESRTFGGNPPPVALPSATSEGGVPSSGLAPAKIQSKLRYLEKRILELERNLRSSRQSSGIGEQFTAQRSAESGFENTVGRQPSGIGEQFTTQLQAESAFEDIAGLQPLPIQRMRDQAARPFMRLWKQLGDAANTLQKYSRQEVKKILKPDPVRRQQVLERVDRVEQVRQNWNPLEAEARSRFNQTNPAPRSKPSAASLETFDNVLRELSRKAFDRLNKMPAALYGTLGDISDYLEAGEREVIRKGVAEQLRQGRRPDEMPVGGNINTGRANVRQAVQQATTEAIRKSQSTSTPIKPPPPRFMTPVESDPLIPMRDDSDLEWLKEYMRRTDPPLLRNPLEGAFLPGGSFDISKLAVEFGTVAAASILRGVYDESMAPSNAAPPVLTQAQPLRTIPFSQQVDAPSGARQTTEKRQELQRTAEQASWVEALNQLRLSLRQILEDSVEYQTSAKKELDLIDEQATFAQYGLSQPLSRELGQLSLRAEKERANMQVQIAQAQKEGLLTEEQANELRKAGLKDVQKYYKDNVAITFELEKQRNLLEMMNDSPREVLSKELVEARKNIDTLTNSGNIAVGIASSIGDAFGSAFKGIVSGSATAGEALAALFQGIVDSFADMVAKMIAEYLKMAVIQGIMSLLPGGGSFGGGAALGQGVPLPMGIGIGAGSGILQNSTGQGFGTLGPNFGIRQFANGGIVTGPTLGLVGEGKYNEAIIPLPDGKSVPVELGGAAGGIQSSIVINIDGNGNMNSNSSGSNASDFGRKIEGAVKQAIVNELRPGGVLARTSR